MLLSCEGKICLASFPLLAPAETAERRFWVVTATQAFMEPFLVFSFLASGACRVKNEMNSRNMSTICFMARRCLEVSVPGWGNKAAHISPQRKGEQFQRCEQKCCTSPEYTSSLLLALSCVVHHRGAELMNL